MAILANFDHFKSPEKKLKYQAPVDQFSAKIDLLKKSDPRPVTTFFLVYTGQFPPSKMSNFRQNCQNPGKTPGSYRGVFSGKCQKGVVIE